MDSIQHRIHADGTGGLAHEPNNMAAAPAVGQVGGSYTQTLTATGTINFNCHIHAGMKGQIMVQ
jgi:plastocyanin